MYSDHNPDRCSYLRHFGEISNESWWMIFVLLAMEKRNLSFALAMTNRSLNFPVE